MKNIISALTAACCLSFLCMAIFSGVGINTAYAHCKGKHSNYPPHCGGGEDPPPLPDLGGSADPQLVFRERDNLPTAFLANSDGSSQTQIWDASIIGSLDAPGKRVLFRGDGLDMLTYQNVAGEIDNVRFGNRSTT